MRRRATIGLILAAALSLVAPGDALAATGFSIVFAGPGETIRQTEVDLKVTGTLRVDFHGDQAAGCEARHVCDERGTTTWSSQSDAALFVNEFRVHGRRPVAAALFVGSGQSDATRTRSRVDRDPAGVAPSTCTDARDPQVAAFDLAQVRGGLVVGLTPPSTGARIFTTRCGGPLDTDVMGLLPTRTMSVGRVRRGRWNVDLSTSRAFMRGGLAGTVTSTLKLVATQGTTSGPERSPAAPSRHLAREIVVRYRVERVAGDVGTTFAGLAEDALCAPLAACGVAGRIDLRPRAAGGTAFLTADAPAAHSVRELRAAVGLAPGGRRAGIDVAGYVNWSDRGAIEAALTQQGTPTCTDSIRPPPGQLTLSVRGSRVEATYGAADYFADLLATRCPGPLFSDVTARRPLARGTVPLRAFGRRRVILRLRSGTAFSGDGYRGTASPDAVVVLERRAVSERTHFESG